MTELEVLSITDKKILRAIASFSSVKALMGKPGSKWTKVDLHYQEVFENNYKDLVLMLNRSRKAILDATSIYRVANRDEINKQRAEERAKKEIELVSVTNELFAIEKKAKILKAQKSILESDLGLDVFKAG